MVKINKYLMAIQLVLLNLIGQNITECAARIKSEQSTDRIDLKLLDAVKKGNKKKVEELIANGANINAINEYQYTLMIASGYGHKKIVELLLSAGSDINIADKAGNTALILATLNDRKEMVELLLNAKANGNAATIHGDTALMLASYNGYKGIVELLLHAGVHVNAANELGDTALILASAKTFGCIAQGTKKEIVKLLLRAGANIDHKNKGCKRAIDLNREINNHEIVKILQDEPARRESKILECQKTISNKISNLQKDPLVNDVIMLISQYTI